MPFTILDGGSFKSDGLNKIIPIPSSADYFKSWNMTKLAASAPTGCVAGEWFGPKFGLGQSAANDGVRWRKSGSSAILIDAFSTSTASNGFTYVTSAPVVEPQAAAAITSITQASNAVVSQVNTYKEGDFVRIYNTTGMLQIAGMVFQISSVSGAGYTLIGLDSSGFAFAATAGNTRRVSKFEAVEPQFLYISAISQAVQAVVTCTVDPSPYYVVGNKIHFSIPKSMGMQEMNQQTGVIVAIDPSTYQITVDIDSSAFSAFAFPASSASPTAGLFATLAPAGSKTSFDPVTNQFTGYEFVKTPFHSGIFVPYLLLASGANSPAGEADDQINYIWYKLET